MSLPYSYTYFGLEYTNTQFKLPTLHIGEANANGNMEEYGCAFPELINEWRRVWSMNSDTYSNFPFGFVQLAQVAPEQNSGFPMIRWFQTNGTGYVPNENMQVIFFYK